MGQAVPAATAHDHPAALVEGIGVPWSALRPAMSELAGGIALEEAVLEAALERRFALSGGSLSDADMERERLDLLAAMEASQQGSGESADTLLQRIRAQRGLGPHRFEALLRRNAMLRSLVAPGVAVSPAEVDLALEIQGGPRYRIRLMVCPTEHAAAQARRALVEGPPAVGLSQAMADLCRERSMHPTAPSGGLVESFSPADPAYPAALREAVRQTEPGGLSPAIAADGRWAFALVEASIPAQEDPTLAQRDQVSRELLRRKQRLAMERLAAELLAETEVLPLDASLGWSHRTHRGGGG